MMSSLCPFTTAERKVFGTPFLGSVGGIYAATDQAEDMPEAVEQIREVMRSRHRLQADQPDDFTIRTQVEFGKVQEGTSQTLTVMLMAIASVSTACRRYRHHEHSARLGDGADKGNRSPYGGWSQTSPYPDTVLDRGHDAQCGRRLHRHSIGSAERPFDDGDCRLAHDYLGRHGRDGIRIFRRRRLIFWFISRQ